MRLPSRGYRAGAVRWLVALTLILPLVAIGGWTAPASADGGLSAQALPSVGVPGDLVRVVGDNWRPQTRVSAVLCGNLGLNGSADCDLPNTATTRATLDGGITLDMRIGSPPTPCPCAVVVRGEDVNDQVTAPFELVGHPTAAPSRSEVKRSMEIGQDVVLDTSLGSLVGASASGRIVVRLRNTGTMSLENPRVSVALGQGNEPTQVIARPSGLVLAPGAEDVLEIPFELPGPAVGRYTVRTSVLGLDEPTEAVTSFATYPWLLIIVGVLILQIPLLGLWRRKLDPAAPEDPLGDHIDGLVVAPRAFGVASVRGLVDDYSDGFATPEAERAPAPLVVVGGP